MMNDLCMPLKNKEKDLRILALDYGERRVGVAICDELGIAAHGLATIVRKNRETDLAAISAFIKRFDVDRIVIGYPIRIDGSEGIQCEKVNRFIHRLETCFKLPVTRWDETLSTKEAEAIMKNNGKKKRGKMDIDRVAASVILQSYLDSPSSKLLKTDEGS
ncbi:MAG: Holliday junction resolvase RuvX [Syntrophales bacterium]